MTKFQPRIRLAWIACLISLVALHADRSLAGDVVIERDVAVAMRDGVVLRADVYRPSGAGPYPVLVFRTPYGKQQAGQSYRIQYEAVQRGYAVVMQDVRGRHASDGLFNPYFNEGRDGYDTIEWVARQPWSNGVVGTFGLSYPGAVQWLAALEQPPHLKAMAPAMTFSSPRNFFYMNGVFDLSWLPWIYSNVAPDARKRLGLAGPGTPSAPDWESVAAQYRGWLPLRDLPFLRREAPFYFEWLAHPPEDPWWDWAELRGRYSKVTPAVLNLSGWHDEAYGPEGAATNFNGLVAARSRDSNPRTNLVIGPWIHGVATVGDREVGDLDFGPEAAVDYDDLVLDFMDHHLRGVRNEFAAAAPVRHFVMGANVWRDEEQWPPAGGRPLELRLGVTPAGDRILSAEFSKGPQSSSFIADPRNPVTDPHEEFGPHDYASLGERKDLLVFDTEPFAQDLYVAGNIVADISVSCDCRDFDLWVKLLDVYPDGRAINLMSPGNDVLRASYREPDRGRQLLEPGRAYRLQLPNLMTSNVFARGHRLRAQISASFAPHLSRNLQTGESEADSARSRVARITIHHGPDAASTLTLPVMPAQSSGRSPSPAPSLGRSEPSTSSNPPATTSLARSKLPSRSR